MEIEITEKDFPKAMKVMIDIIEDNLKKDDMRALEWIGCLEKSIKNLKDKILQARS